VLALAALCGAPAPAFAADATWLASPSDGNFNNTANWSGGVVPNGTATFDASSMTSLSFSAGVSMGGWTFNPGAPAYTFTSGQNFEFTGAGIIVSGGSVAITNNSFFSFRNASAAGPAAITNNNLMIFWNTSTADNATITNNDTLQFTDTSTAGTAMITSNSGGGGVSFHGSSTAGQATITNNSGANLNFWDTSTAGDATITNNSGANMNFLDSSTAGGATIDNASGATLVFFNSSAAANAIIANNGTMTFSQSSTAGTASITNSGSIQFADSTTAGDATITTTNGGTTSIGSTASGGSGRFITQSGGTFNISGLGSAGTTAGSIEGAGSYVLGAKNLTVGSNDLSTEVSGVISGVGGSLTKVGSGTFTLTGTNTYTGATTVSDGTLQIGKNGDPGSIASATVDVGASGTLQYVDSSDAGSATISNSGVMKFFNTSTAGNASITNTNTLDFGDNSSAGTAAISSDAWLTFWNASTAGDATITTTNGGTTSFVHASSGGSAQFVTQAGGTVDISGLSSGGTTAGSIEGAGNYVLGAKNLTVGSNGLDTTVSGVISGVGGSLTKTGNGTLILSGANTYTGATTVDDGVLEVSGSIASATVDVDTASASLLYVGSASAGSAAITNDGGLGFWNSSTANDANITNTGNVHFFTTSAAGTATVTNNGGAVTFHNSSTAANATINNNGTLQFQDSSDAGSATITNNSNLYFVNTASAEDATITTANGATTQLSDTATGGAARFITQSGGTFDISGLSNGGATAGSIEGAGDYVLGAKNLDVGSNDLSTTISGVISGVGGSLTKSGSGTLNLTGTNTYTGDTTVNAGTLRVNGSIASSLTTINSGATLGGNGTVGDLTINNGGHLAPGNSIGTITVNGNLTFASGSTYEVEVSPTGADLTTVTGSATLAGTAKALFQPGTPDHTYTILTAAGGLGGTTFDSLTTVNLPAGFSANLDYSGNDVLLNLTANSSGGGFPANQQRVSEAITGYFNRGGSLPSQFVTLLGLPDDERKTALSQLSGEATDAARGAAFHASSQFMGLMLTPRGAATPACSPTFAGAAPLAVPIAYGIADEPGSPTDPPRATAWASGFAGGSSTDGAAATGSHSLSAHTYGFAAGIDEILSPDASIGLAFATGNGSWSLSDALGGGQSRDYQLGLNGTARDENLYATAALAYGFHRMTTQRTAPGGSALSADFDAHSLAARIEAGMHVTADDLGLAPYVAFGTQSFFTPGYQEADPDNSGFGLSYDARTATSARAEIGSRFTHEIALDNDTILKLDGRLAYARDWTTASALAASFASLPGSSFTVSAATPPKHLALASFGGELILGNGLSLSAHLDGEFSQVSTSCAGMATLSYSW
jgi:autotransporter-associated beta strand protein